VLGSAAVGTIADQHQTCGHGSGDAGKDLHDILNALDGAEVGEMDEKPLVSRGKARAHGGDEFRVAGVDVAVDEVLDNFDLGGDAEGLAGTVAEMTGDGGDTDGLDDAAEILSAACSISPANGSTRERILSRTWFAFTARSDLTEGLSWRLRDFTALQPAGNVTAASTRTTARVRAIGKIDGVTATQCPEL